MATVPYDDRADLLDRRMQLAREWDELVERVRQVTGFEDFLRSPTAESLLRAAGKGPVIVVNASRRRCDALIVRPTGVSSLPLAGLSYDEATQRARDYLAALHALEDADHNLAAAAQLSAGTGNRSDIRREHQAAVAAAEAQQAVDSMLVDVQAWMWDVIAEPILRRLGLDGRPTGSTRTWPRVWWCPTGPLTILPVHTAGRHGAPAVADRPKAVFDCVVSSYTPTVRALVSAQLAGRPDVEAEQRRDKMLFVTVPDDPSRLPLETTEERNSLRARFPEGMRTELVGEGATRSAVTQALTEHRWAHFSCHGEQELSKPSHGGLVLHDGVLTVADIAARRFDADFAGLSACKTALGGTRLPDEMITLAAAFHYTGFRHVVATLWSVRDDAASMIFSELYDRIAIGGRLMPDAASYALHDAVRRLRQLHPDWPHVWAPFVHFGP